MHEQMSLMTSVQVKQKLIVMLTIDGSNSLSGGKWKDVCKAIDQFIKNLSEEDMIATIIYNDKAKLVTQA